MKSHFRNFSLDIEFWGILHLFLKFLYVFFRSLEYLFGYGFMKQNYYEVCRNIIKLYYSNQYLLVLVSFSSNILLCESLKMWRYKLAWWNIKHMWAYTKHSLLWMLRCINLLFFYVFMLCSLYITSCIQLVTKTKASKTTSEDLPSNNSFLELCLLVLSNKWRSQH